MLAHRGPGGSTPPRLSAERPRDVGWKQAAGLLFGDWGTSRLYVLGLAFAFAGPMSFWLILGMSVLILAVGWAYTQICRIYPDGGGVYTAARQRSALLGVASSGLIDSRNLSAYAMLVSRAIGIFTKSGSPRYCVRSR